MTETRDRLLHHVFRLADLLVMVMAFAIAFVLTGHFMHPGGLDEFLAVRIKVGNFVIALAFATCWYLLFTSFGIYSSRRHRLLTSEWWLLTKATAVGTLLLSGLGLLFDLEVVNGLFITIFFSSCRLAGTANEIGERRGNSHRSDIDWRQRWSCRFDRGRRPGRFRLRFWRNG